MKNDQNGQTSETSWFIILLVIAGVVWFFATHLWALWLLLGLGAAALGLACWWDQRPSVIAAREAERLAAAKQDPIRKDLADQILGVFKSCPTLIGSKTLEAPWGYSPHYDSDPHRFRGLTWRDQDPDSIMFSNEALSDCLRDLKLLVKKEEEEIRRIEARKTFEKQLLQMPTSTQQHIIGRRITRQLRMVRVDGCDTHFKADMCLREEAHNAGADGIINMRIRPYPGGNFSAEGDAVLLERT